MISLKLGTNNRHMSSRCWQGFQGQRSEVKVTARPNGNIHLRSAETSTLLVPSTRRSTLGDRSFPVAVTRPWNALPQLVRNAPSLPVFRRELKTVLFRSSFPDVISQWVRLTSAKIKGLD